MKYIIYKNWHNGGKQIIEETNNGDYADKRVKELNKRIDFHHKNQPISYSLETIHTKIRFSSGVREKKK